MPGLIQTEIDKTDPLKSVAGYDPEKLTLDTKTDTVAGQLDTIISKDSPLMQGARTRATQAANSRGLINTTMNVQAGEEAVHNAALPIAQSDAAINLRAKELNQGAGNAASQFNATTQSQAALQERAGQQAIEQQTLRGEQETALTAQRGELDKQLQLLRGTQAERLAQIDVDSRALLQSSAAATTLYTNITNNMSKIMSDPNMTVENKQAAIDQHINLIESGLAVIGGIAGLNLEDLLTF